MSHKIITVPKSKTIEQALNYDEAKDSDLLELVLSEDKFYQLFNCGIFSIINQNAKTLIDDFEEEWIRDPKDIQKAIKALKNEDYSHDKELEGLVNKIINLMEEAVEREVGIYFFF